jgi:hypothetical protein
MLFKVQLINAKSHRKLLACIMTTPTPTLVGHIVETKLIKLQNYDRIKGL